MNHPKPEDWLPYLDGEASPEAAERLSEHLKSCPQCAAEMEARRRTIQKLQRLDWPRRRHTTPIWFAPALKWGLAAAIVLGLGFSLGRSSAPNAKQIEATVAAQVKGDLRQEMRSDLLAAFASDSQSAKDNFCRQLAVEVAQASTKGRAEERRAFIEFCTQLRQEQTSDYLSLRQAIETLASTADDRLQQTRRQLAQMEAYAVPAHYNP